MGQQHLKFAIFGNEYQAKKSASIEKILSGSFRCQLNGRGGLTKGRSPAVEMGQPFLLQRAILEIPHHGVKLRHTVADRGPGRKDDAAPACQLVHILALHKHIRRFLRFRCG